MDESAEIEIRYKSSQVFMAISSDELTLLESMLPDLLRELMQEDATNDD